MSPKCTQDKALLGNLDQTMAVPGYIQTRMGDILFIKKYHLFYIGCVGQVIGAIFQKLGPVDLLSIL